MENSITTEAVCPFCFLQGKYGIVSSFTLLFQHDHRKGPVYAFMTPPQLNDRLAATDIHSSVTVCVSNLKRWVKIDSGTGYGGLIEICKMFKFLYVLIIILFKVKMIAVRRV